MDQALSGTGMAVKKEEKEDFTFDESYVKRQKTSGAPDGQPSALSSPAAQALRNELNMNWDLIEVRVRTHAHAHFNPYIFKQQYLQFCHWVLVSL